MTFLRPKSRFFQRHLIKNASFDHIALYDTETEPLKRTGKGQAMASADTGFGAFSRSRVAPAILLWIAYISTYQGDEESAARRCLLAQQMIDRRKY
jgi:hypothetical protein